MSIAPSAVPSHGEFAVRYAAALNGHLAADDDDALAQAFLLGREAVDNGLGVLDFASIHQHALQQILSESTPEVLTRTSERASAFFSESLAPFEMVHRGFREANAKIVSLNSQLEQKVLELRQLAAIVEASDDAITASSLDGTILSWNPGAERLYGYTAAEALGRPVAILTPADRERETQEIIEAIARGESILLEETVALRKDGSRVDVSLTVSPIRTEDGTVTAAAAIARDITQRKQAEAEQAQLEAQLRQAQKMEAIGNLAGGIAHDFNNILLIIRGFSALLLKDIDGEPRAKVLQIDLAAQRAAEVTQKLLAFSRQQIFQLESIDLNAAVEETLGLVGRLIGEQIELETELGSGLAPILVDRGQLQQVILNLLVNARDAMPTGGKLAIRTRNVQLDEGYAANNLEVSPGAYALLEVTDSGIGMDERTRGRVFDPFFTTKQEGTGLGLATVYGILKQSGGHITLYSEPGLGTTFRVYFRPALAAKPSPLTVPEISSLEGHETILLVEDAEMVRSLVITILKPHGYTILEAADGIEALEIAERAPATIDLLLTDVVMPGMNGRELADKLMAKQGELKVLFTSGYPADTVVRHGIAEARVAFIQKPYTPEQLAHKIRETLDTPANVTTA